MTTRSTRNRALAVAVLLSATACVRVEDPATSKRSAIKYYTWAVEPAEMVVIRKEIEEFQKANPGISVQLVTAPGDAYYDKMTTLIAGGSPPDVMYLQPERFAEYASRNGLMNIQPYVDRDRSELDLNDFFPQSLVAFTWRGALYGLPADAGPMVLFYNKKLFQEKGLAYPDKTWDWNTLLQASQKLTQKDDGGRVLRYGLSTFDWHSFVWQHGGDILSSDGLRCVVDQPQAVEAFQFFIDLTRKYGVAPPPMFVSGDDNGKYFKTGRAAMFCCGVWYYTQLREVKDLEWDVAILPRDLRRASLMIGLGWCIPRNTKSPEAAWTFLKFLASRQNLRARAETGYTFPARRSVAESDVFLSPGNVQNNRAFIETMDFAVPLPKTPVFGRAISTIQDEITLAFLGYKTTEEACRTATVKVNRLIANRD